jgi:hypothetical protein
MTAIYDSNLARNDMMNFEDDQVTMNHVVLILKLLLFEQFVDTMYFYFDVNQVIQCPD